MSGPLTTWARRQVFKQFLDMSTSERFLLVLLTDNGSWDDETETWSAFPAQKTLADDSGASVRTVQRLLDKIESRGIIVRQRKKKAGGALGNSLYFFNISVVDNPVVRIGRLPETQDTTPMSSLENSRHDRMSPPGPDPHELKRRQNVAPVDNSGGGDTSVVSEATPVSGPAREVNAHASFNPQLVNQSSSSRSGEDRPHVVESAAGGAAGDDDDDERKISTTVDRGVASAASGDADPAASPPSGQATEVHRGVDLTALAGFIQRQVQAGHRPAWVLTRAVDLVLDRATSAVNNPQAFVSAAFKRDQLGWRSWFDQTEHNLPPGPTAPVTAPVGVTARPRREPCPINEHARSSYLKINCPACRFSDFPTALTAMEFASLATEIQEKVRAVGVMIHDQGQEVGRVRTG